MAETGPRRALPPLASPPESGVPPRASREQEERPAHIGGNGEPWAGWAPVSRGATRRLRDGRRRQPFPKGPFPARPPAGLGCTLPRLVRPGLAPWAVPRVLGAPGGLSPWRALARVLFRAQPWPGGRDPVLGRGPAPADSPAPPPSAQARIPAPDPAAAQHRVPTPPGERGCWFS